MLTEPIREYVEDIQEQTPCCFVHIILGQLVMDTYAEQLLHQNSTLIFNLALSHLDRVAVTSVPYQIHHHDLTEADAEAKHAATPPAPTAAPPAA
jgi:hypothetical protein